MSSMTLNDLTDVTISNPIVDQRIVYDGSKWVNYFAKVMLSYDNFFKGKAITVTKEQYSSTITLPSNTTDYVFYVPSAGTYELSYEQSGYSYTASVTVEDPGEMYYTTLLSQDTITVTLYSATGDTLTYTDADGVEKTAVFETDSSSKEVELTIIPSGIPITFTSTVALDPNDCVPEDAEVNAGRLLGGYYSRTITVNSQTTEIYIMPDGALYWYGWMKNNEFEKITPTNGWTWMGSSDYSLGVAYWDKNVMLNNHTSSDPNRDSWTKIVGTSTSSKKTGLSSLYVVASSGGKNGYIVLQTSKNVYSNTNMTDKLASVRINSPNGARSRKTFDLSDYIFNQYYINFLGYIGYDNNVWALVVTEAE